MLWVEDGEAPQNEASSLRTEVTSAYEVTVRQGVI